MIIHDFIDIEDILYIRIYYTLRIYYTYVKSAKSSILISSRPDFNHITKGL